VAGAVVTPGFATPRSELPWLPYGETDRVIISSHNFTPGYLYPSLRTTLPLLGYYPRLNAGASASDQFTVDGTQDGTLTNGVTRPDLSGLCYDFASASNQYILTANSSALNNLAQMTVAFWFYPTTALLSPPSPVLIDKGVGAGSWYVQYTGAALRFFFSDAGGYSAGSPSTGVWSHYAMSYDGANVRVYLNGSLISTTAKTGTVSTGTGSLNLGRYVGGGFYYNGRLDDIIIWPTGLDGTNVGYLASQRGAIYATA